MNLSRNAAAIAVLSALAIIGVIVLIATGHPVPDYLSLIAVSGLGALAGVAVPDSAAGGVSAELTSVIGDLAGKLDTVIGHVFGPTPSASVPAPSTAAAALTADLAQGGPLPAPAPVTNPPAVDAAVPPVAP